MNADRKRADRISDTQKDIILAFMKDDLQFAAGKFDENLTPTKALSKWKDLTNILNTFPGPKKDWRSWKKCWQDMRSKTKKKASENTQQSGKISSLSRFQEGILEVVQKSEELHGTCDDNNCDVEMYKECERKSFQHDYDLDGHNLDNNASPLNITENVEDIEVEDSKECISLLFTNEPTNESESELTEQNEKLTLNYHERKIAALERIAIAKEKSVKAKEKIASELTTIATLLTKLVDK